MKKVILSALMLSSGLSFAQVDFSSTRFGLTLGGNYSRVTNAHNPSGPRYGLQAGAMALIPVDNYDQFYLQPEVVYYAAGESGKDKNAKKNPGYNAKYYNNYLSIPVYFKGYFSEAESEFFGMIGPRFNFLLSQNVENPSKPYYAAEQLEAYPGINGKASTFNFAVAAGLGFSYKRMLELALKYDLGLSNTYKGLMSEAGADPDIAKRKTEQVVSVSLSYIFE